MNNYSGIGSYAGEFSDFNYNFGRVGLDYCFTPDTELLYKKDISGTNAFSIFFSYPLGFGGDVGYHYYFKPLVFGD